MQKLKILLINPPRKQYKYSQKLNVLLPLNLLYLSAMIEDIAEVQILDCLVYKFQEKKFKTHTHFGTSFDDIRRVLEAYNPDVVGITIPFSTQTSNSQKVAFIAREVNPQTVIIMGGPHVTVRYENILKKNVCDYAIVGEGEYTFREFVQKYANKKDFNKIKGLAYKSSSSEIYFEPREYCDNLDDLPLPAYHLIEVDDYFNHKYYNKIRGNLSKSISLITSRGCPYQCTFCSVRLHMGHQYRSHSSQYILNHINYIKKNLRTNEISFEDDNLIFDQQRFNEILDLIIDNDVFVQWDTPNGIRVNHLNHKMIEKMKRSGCVGVALALESGDQETLDDIIRKKVSLRKIPSIVASLAHTKIHVTAFYVIGFPGETVAKARKTIILSQQLLKNYFVEPHLMIATPLYGTDLFKECQRKQIIKEELDDIDFSNATHPLGHSLILNPKMSPFQVRMIGIEFILRIKYEYIRRRIIKMAGSFFTRKQM